MFQGNGILVGLKTVVIVSDSAVIDGGAAKVALDTARIMRKMGLEVIIFAGGSTIEPTLPSGIRVELTGKESIATGARSVNAAIRGVWDFRTMRDFAKLLRGCNKDETVIHFHSWGSRLSPSVFHAARKSGMATIVTAHDYLLGCPNACYFNFPQKRVCSVVPCSMQCVLANCDRISRKVKAFRLARFAVQTAALRRLRPTVAYVSGFQRDRLNRIVPFRHDSRVIRNPVTVANRTSKYTGQTGTLLYAGRVEAEKGADLVCEAAMLSKTNATVIGSGTELEKLEKLYPVINFLHWLAPDALYEKMLQSAALVFPSRWYEAAPLTPIEAQLVAGLPCIVSDECAARESIEDGVTGLIFRSGDARDLARCLTLITDPVIHGKLRGNILEQQPAIRKRYAAQTYADLMHGLYQGVLSANTVRTQ